MQADFKFLIGKKTIGQLTTRSDDNMRTALKDMGINMKYLIFKSKY